MIYNNKLEKMNNRELLTLYGNIMDLKHKLGVKINHDDYLAIRKELSCRGYAQL